MVYVLFADRNLAETIIVIDVKGEGRFGDGIVDSTHGRGLKDSGPMRHVLREVKV